MIVYSTKAIIGDDQNKKLIQILNNINNIDTVLTAAGRIAANNFVARVPVESGLLRDRIQIITPVTLDGNEKFVGVAPLTEIGRRRVGRNRGTIARFIRDFPQFRRRSLMLKNDPSLAWWVLPPAGKVLLDQKRMAGRYGGSQAGKIVPLYWPAQDEGTYPKPGGGIAKNFIESANSDTVYQVDIMARNWLA